jgi:hypothetical protein
MLMGVENQKRTWFHRSAAGALKSYGADVAILQTAFA